MSTQKPISPNNITSGYQPMLLVKQDCETSQSGLLGPPRLHPMVDRRYISVSGDSNLKVEPLTPTESITSVYEFCVNPEDMQQASSGRAIKRHHSPSNHHISSQIQPPHSLQASSNISIPYQPSAQIFYDDLSPFNKVSTPSSIGSRTSLPSSLDHTHHSNHSQQRHRSENLSSFNIRGATSSGSPNSGGIMSLGGTVGTGVQFETSVARATSSTSPSELSSGTITAPGFTTPESAFYQYQNRMEAQLCQVCGESAAGFHHGAYVCEACKKFFMRHSLTDAKLASTCPTGGKCPITKGSRGKCQQCRYRKCIEIGMYLKDPETQNDVDISNIPCRVCGGRSSGFHFGALTCEGCKGFFRRTEGSATRLVCSGGQDSCAITPRSRNACKSCRFQRCLAVGMSKVGSRIGRQPNAVKFHCAMEIKKIQVMKDLLTGSTTNSLTNSERGVSMRHASGNSSSESIGGGAPGSTSTQTLSPPGSKNHGINAGMVGSGDGLNIIPSSSSPGTCELAGSAAGLLEAVVMGAIQKRANTTTPTSSQASPLSNGFPLDVPRKHHSIGSVHQALPPSINQRAKSLLPSTSINDPLSTAANHLRMVQKNHPTATLLQLATTAADSSSQVDLAGPISVLPVSPANSTGSIGGSSVTPLTEAIDRFSNGMRTATEFLRMPNTYFKSRFQMSSIPAEHCGNIALVWDHMMNHFHMHAQQVVQFAKLIPGFNQLSLSTRSALVREGMYSVLLLLLSRDFQPDNDHFNYFDFSSEERAVIMHHFPSFKRIQEHLRTSGRLAHKLNLSLPELSISCAIEILRTYNIIEESENSNVQSLYLLARNSLIKCMSTGNSDLTDEVAKNRWTRVEALSEMLAGFNKEHHQILTDLKSARRDLQFPELYVEMFQLADDAAALVSAAVVAYCRNNAVNNSVAISGSSSDISNKAVSHITGNMIGKNFCVTDATTLTSTPTTVSESLKMLQQNALQMSANSFVVNPSTQQLMFNIIDGQPSNSSNSAKTKSSSTY